jgi:hypothetical protein
VAAREPAQRQQAAAQAAVTVHGFQRVLRAGRIEAASRPEQRTEQQLVGAKQKFNDRFLMFFV